ncbi:MAG: hypothetical protein ACKOAK_10970 [Ignavibacteria bacterium]
MKVRSKNIRIVVLLGLLSAMHVHGQGITQKHDSVITLRYSVTNPMQYTYAVKSMVSQSLGEMIDFHAKTSASTELYLQTEKDKDMQFTYSYSPGKVTLSGLSMAGIPDTTFTSNGPLIPSIKEHISPKGIILSRISGENAMNLSARSEQLMQSLTQGARFFLLEFPTSPIHIGSVWNIRKSDTVGTQTNEGKSSIVLNTELNCKVIRTEHINGMHHAFIECGSNDLGFTGNIEQQGITMTIDGEGSARGTYAIDLQTGLPLNASLLMEYELRMAATGQEQMIVPVQMTMETIYSRLRSMAIPMKSPITLPNKRR